MSRERTPEFRKSLDTAVVASHSEFELIARMNIDDYGQSSGEDRRSEEHTSELQSHSFISYAVFFLNKSATPELYPLPLPDAFPFSVVASHSEFELIARMNIDDYGQSSGEDR